MSSSHLLHIIFVLVLIAAILLIHLPAHAYDPGDQQRYQICSSPIPCANIPKMSYPFWGSIRPDYCGHPAFHLKSCGGEVAEITIMSHTYRVLEVNQMERTLRVARADLCPAGRNPTFDTAHFDYFFYGTKPVWLYYNCEGSGHPSRGRMYQIFCYFNQTQASNDYLDQQNNNNYLAFLNSHYYYYYAYRSCKGSGYAYGTYDDNYELNKRLNSGFELEWKADNILCDDCQVSGGLCGYDSASGKFSCHCKDKSYPFTCGSFYEGPYDEHYLNCLGSGFQCVNLKNISYPFWEGNKPEYCGHPDFKLNCSGSLNAAEITIMSKKYRVLETNQTAHALRVDVEDFYEAYICPAYPAHNLSFIGTIFSDHPPDNQDLTIFYNCRMSINASTEIYTSYQCNTEDVFNFILTDELRLQDQTANGIPLSNVIRTCNGSAVIRVAKYSPFFFMASSIGTGLDFGILSSLELVGFG